MEKKKASTFPLIMLIILGSIGIGTICTTAVTCLMGGWNVTVMRYLIWIAASVLFGLASYLIFWKSSLNLPVGIALHCFICMVVTFAACRFCRFEVENSIWLEILIIFVAIYAIIFCCIYFTAKAEAKKINDRISER